MHWNPFSHLIEVKTKKYISGRFFRSSYWERIKDSFWVINGSGLGLDENATLGLLDYVFPVARILWECIDFLNKNSLRESGLKNTLFGATILILIIPAALSTVAKFLTSSVLTCIAAPLAGLTHFFIKPKQDKLIDTIKHLRIQPINNCDGSETFSDIDLTKENNLENVFTPQELENMFAKSLSRDLLYNKKNIYVFPFCKPFEDKDEGYGYWYNGKTNGLDFRGGIPSSDNFSLTLVERSRSGKKIVGCIKITPENSDGIKALLNTNMFFATKNLEETKTLSAVERICGINSKPG